MPDRASEIPSAVVGTGRSAWSRRGLLKSAALGLPGLALSELAARCSRAGQTAPRARSVLVVYAGGGISHHDAFDPKPEAPVEVRGEFQATPTAVPGVQFTDLLPALARDLHRFSLIRSVYHTQTDHGVSAYLMLRGYSQPDPSFDRPENQLRANPNMGSHVARLVGTRNGLPAYICVPGLSYLATVNYYTAGWMGRAYDPFLLKSDPNLDTFAVSRLSLEPVVSDERQTMRRLLLTELGRDRHLTGPAISSVDVQYRRAFEALMTETTRRVFDVAREPASIRDAYGRTRIGQSCLVARRLIEAGVPFVTVDDDVWDHHGTIFPALRQRLPELDAAFSTLLGDLSARGLLDSTLVLLLTDFGRTPTINKGAGRDHWPGVFSILAAGAGIPGGQVIGSSDRLGAAPHERPVTPQDVAATLYHLLGLDAHQEYKGVDGRAHLMLDRGEPLPELLGSS
ncbi:MAG: DUF1501 domain-containing protein [Planctomycetia bacterium]|nr:DUF1501 domain-containing protein [Planctomycetia bacterium]